MGMLKKKICEYCFKLSFIYKNINGKKYCKFCTYKHFKNPVKIKKISDKKKQKDIEYFKLRKIFLESHVFCEAKLTNCTMIATDIHHLYSGKNRDKYYLQTNTWKSVCRNCHNFIHDFLSSEEAIELNLKLIEN